MEHFCDGTVRPDDCMMAAAIFRLVNGETTGGSEAATGQATEQVSSDTIQPCDTCPLKP